MEDIKPRRKRHAYPLLSDGEVATPLAKFLGHFNHQLPVITAHVTANDTRGLQPPPLHRTRKSALMPSISPQNEADCSTF